MTILEAMNVGDLSFSKNVSKVAVLVSGNGSNLGAFIERQLQGLLSAKLSLVISNRPEVRALERARNANIPSLVIDHQQYKDRDSFDKSIHLALMEHNIDLVILAGFMRILGRDLLTKWQGKMLNIHPSLLPRFKGLNTHQRALAEQESHHGCSIHWVEPELDAGPLLSQARFEINASDTPDTLATKVHQLEHLLYPLTFQWMATGRLPAYCAPQNQSLKSSLEKPQELTPINKVYCYTHAQLLSLSEQWTTSGVAPDPHILLPP